MPVTEMVTKMQQLMKPDLKQEFGSTPNIEDKKVWKCDPCGKSYNLIGNFQRHNRLEHPDGKVNENHKCEICGKSFKKKINLGVHLNTVHIKRNILKCKVCGMEFSSSSGLKSHSDSVHKVVKYKCQTCDKSYSCLENLKGHINQEHDKVNSYDCDICNKVFLKKNYLAKHKRDDHENKIRVKQKCETCDKEFVGLENHIKMVHEGTKEECRFCGKEYTYKTLIGAQKQESKM